MPDTALNATCPRRYFFGISVSHLHACKELARKTFVLKDERLLDFLNYCDFIRVHVVR